MYETLRFSSRFLQSRDRYQPGSELAEWFRERVGTLAGRTRRIAIVAMARKLLIALWRYIETGLIPAGVQIQMASVAAV